MRFLSRLLRIAFAAALTAYILWKSHPSEVVAAAAHADWRPIAIAIALVFVDRALMAYRWVELLCIIPPGTRPPIAAIMRIFFVSTFVGTFLPASIGGDAVRAYALARQNVAGSDAVASVFMDRMLGVASILMMAILGLALAHDLAKNATIDVALVVAAAACAFTLVLVLSDAAVQMASRLLGLLPDAIHRSGDRLLNAIRRYSSYHRHVVGVLISSIAVQILRIVQAYFLGRGLRIDASIDAYFAFIPLILLVMLLPVTFNGIGTSQVAFVWFFARAGVAAAPAFALSVLFVALGIVGNLPGGLLYVFGKSGIERAQASTAAES